MLTFLSHLPLRTSGSGQEVDISQPIRHIYRTFLLTNCVSAMSSWFRACCALQISSYQYRCRNGHTRVSPSIYTKTLIQGWFLRAESRLPSFIEFVDAISIKTSGDQCNAPIVSHPAQRYLTSSPSEHRYAHNASRFEKSEIPDDQPRTPCKWQGCPPFPLLSEDQSAHEALYHQHLPSAKGALNVTTENMRPRLGGASEDDSPPREKRCCVSRHHFHSTGSLNLTTTGRSASSTTRARSSLRCTSSRRHVLKTNNSDENRAVQRKVEGKVAHKRAEQKRRNETSSLITELKHRLPPQFSEGWQPRDQRDIYTKNWTLKAMLNYDKPRATVIEEKLIFIEVQAAVNAALEERNAALEERIAKLEERNAALKQQIQQSGTWNEPHCWLRTKKADGSVYYCQIGSLFSIRCRGTVQPWSRETWARKQADQVALWRPTGLFHSWEGRSLCSMSFHPFRRSREDSEEHILSQTFFD